MRKECHCGGGKKEGKRQRNEEKERWERKDGEEEGEGKKIS